MEIKELQEKTVGYLNSSSGKVQSFRQDHNLHLAELDSLKAYPKNFKESWLNER